MARFMQKGTTKFYWLLTIATSGTTLIPTAAEVNGGTRLDTQISEVNGFSFSNNPITTPDMANTFVTNIPGEDSADTSSLMFYEDKVTNPIRTALAKGTNGFVVILFAGTAGASPALGDKCDVWPAQVASNARAYSAGNEASKYNVVFAMTSAPGLDRTLT